MRNIIGPHKDYRGSAKVLALAVINLKYIFVMSDNQQLSEKMKSCQRMDICDKVLHQAGQQQSTQVLRQESLQVQPRDKNAS